MPPAAINNSKSRPRPALLCILDGWGSREAADDNAISAAQTPNYSRMLKECPHALLATSGRAVGLPDGQMGNSEVGHMNIGAGRVIEQDLPRIDDAIADGSIATLPVLLDLIAKVKKAKGGVHLMGLMSPGGVHSHQKHMVTLARILSNAGVPIFVHAFLDGRDTPPKSASGYVKTFIQAVKDLPGLRLATISGRYYAMDRDKRWDRVAKTYAAIANAKGERFDDAVEAIQRSYENGITDEFVVPCVLGDYAGVADGDALLFANFRGDRAREISTALLDPGFEEFDRERLPKFSTAAGLTEYSEALKPLMGALFPPEEIADTLGEYAANLGLKQLRIAETEKYAHVTFFLNGGREDQFEGEERILVPSPKVATYDHQPEMSAPIVTDELETAILSGKYDLIVCNFANPDMVGHTGIMQAAIEAVHTIDNSLGRLRAAIEKVGGVMLVTADHGNIEMMKDPETGEPHTAHTTLDVPIIAINAKGTRSLTDGRLADVAPTLLDMMGLEKPKSMTGHSLCVPTAVEAAI